MIRYNNRAVPRSGRPFAANLATCADCHRSRERLENQVSFVSVTREFNSVEKYLRPLAFDPLDTEINHTACWKIFFIFAKYFLLNVYIKSKKKNCKKKRSYSKNKTKINFEKYLTSWPERIRYGFSARGFRIKGNGTLNSRRSRSCTRAMPRARVTTNTKTYGEETMSEEVIFPSYYACARERDYKISGFFYRQFYANIDFPDKSRKKTCSTGMNAHAYREYNA
ncbi:hypothetical protein PUN28_012489 [Cardiocondyla obscurior]|uniref:Uncharacterized protein n=1 Tax=Cardiocondyla obscurior TaxID=286306 RepID=A0AAW2FH24_9HYME